jgi:hypothetical protein
MAEEEFKEITLVQNAKFDKILFISCTVENWAMSLQKR